jgi:hypothetical protein
MARLPKKLDQDRTFQEDFDFDFGFALAMMESGSYLHAETALVEMVGIVRDRIKVLFSRDGDGEALGEAAAALVLMEGLLTKWLLTFPPATGAVEAALTFATESIDNFDSAMAEVSATEARPSIALRELVKLEPNTPHAA